jgi:hypothetical protein
MALNDIIFEKENGGMGRPAANEDIISGLIMALDGDLACTNFEEFETTGEGDDLLYVAKLNFYQQLSARYKIEAVKITEEKPSLSASEKALNAIDYHVREFFRMSPTGILYLAIRLCGEAEKEDIRQLQYYAGGLLRQVGILTKTTANIGEFQEACTGDVKNPGGLFAEHQPLSVIMTYFGGVEIEDMEMEAITTGPITVTRTGADSEEVKVTVTEIVKVTETGEGTEKTVTKEKVTVTATVAGTEEGTVIATGTGTIIGTGTVKVTRTVTEQKGTDPKKTIKGPETIKEATVTNLEKGTVKVKVEGTAEGAGTVTVTVKGIPAETLNDLTNEDNSLEKPDFSNVSVLVSCDLNPELKERIGLFYNYGCIGTALGAISKAAVHECIAWVQKFPLGLREPGFICGDLLKNVSMGNLGLINNNRYIFVRTHVGNANNYFNDSHTLDVTTSDYAYIENVRTIDKATRGIRKNLLPYLNAPLYVDAKSGTLRPDMVAFFETTAGRALEDMEKAGELSGYKVEIDPAQNVLVDSELKIQIKKVPVGVMRMVRIKIGYTTSL